ncbi:2-C-methyl-D-erythritol 4-phosphate cytidylyltransferase [Ruminococcaceae bacterium OttesenSCG-928-L11]|nr:2-C-methyl-D-erythritol 4-phosphate cytidylyltransferase [Ruminococcaceae bacterium OttesenSCG-928-L11]
MGILERFRKQKQPARSVSAVIVAAGSARRMGDIDKLRLLLGDMPVVVWSIGQFCACPSISEIVVVCREEEIPDYYRMVQDFELDKVTQVVAGGRERQDSVYAGIAACAPDAAYVAIHDGARPLIAPALIENCVAAAMEYGAAAVGVPVKDTIKVMGGDGFIAATPDRATLWAIQTPQIFEAQAYRAAMENARREQRHYTDDCQLMEYAGKNVFIAEGSYENIKITTPEDIALANGILAFREGLIDVELG